MAKDSVLGGAEIWNYILYDVPVVNSWIVHFLAKNAGYEGKVGVRAV